MTDGQGIGHSRIGATVLLIYTLVHKRKAAHVAFVKHCVTRMNLRLVISPPRKCRVDDDRFRHHP